MPSSATSFFKVPTRACGANRVIRLVRAGRSDRPEPGTGVRHTLGSGVDLDRPTGVRSAGPASSSRPPSAVRSLRPRSASARHQCHDGRDREKAAVREFGRCSIWPQSGTTDDHPVQVRCTRQSTSGLRTGNLDLLATGCEPETQRARSAARAHTHQLSADESRGGERGQRPTARSAGAPARETSPSNATDSATAAAISARPGPAARGADHHQQQARLPAAPPPAPGSPRSADAWPGIREPV
jgi:hypothetical protein